MKTLDYNLVKADALEYFLLSYGWVVVKSFKNGVDVWKSKRNQKKVWVPKDCTFDDYEEAIEEVIDVLAFEEQLSSEEVVLRLKQLYLAKDLLQIRVDASDIKSGNISFNDGVHVFNSLKDIMLGAVKELSGSFKGLKSKFMLDTDLGQTAIGSYIVNAYLPLLNELDTDSKQLQLDNLDGETIGRKVNKTLINRLIKLKKIIDHYSDTNSNVLIQELLTIGYTKQECNAVEKLFGEVGNRDWQVKVLWSHVQQEPSNQVSFVEFSKNDAVIVRKISEKLKSTDVREGVSIFARVVGLKRDHALEETTGTVTIKSDIGDIECTIKAEMDDVCYAIANDAHKRKKYVKIEGDLLKARIGKLKRFFMRKVTSVEVVEGDLDILNEDPQLLLLVSNSDSVETKL
jgi:hypothetical protein